MKLTREEYEARRATRPDIYPDIYGAAAPCHPPSDAEPEPPVRNEPVAKAEREEGHAMRVRVCVTSFRVRLLDPDNLCPKYFVDCLRYANCIRDDRPEDIALEIRQEKVESKLLERTEIEVTPA